MSGNLPDDWPAGYYTCSACGVEAHASGATACLCAEQEADYRAYELTMRLLERIRAEVEETNTDWGLVMEAASELGKLATDEFFRR